MKGRSTGSLGLTRTANTAFAENQLSPRLISLSLRSPTHPSILQHTRVRASTGLAASFTLVRDRSRGFGSSPRDSDGCPPRFHCAFVSLLRLAPLALTRSFIMLKVRCGRSPPSTTCQLPRFGLSFTVLVHYRSRGFVGGLGRGTYRLPTLARLTSVTPGPGTHSRHGLNLECLATRVPRPSSLAATTGLSLDYPPLLLRCFVPQLCFSALRACFLLSETVGSSRTGTGSPRFALSNAIGPYRRFTPCLDEIGRAHV